MGAGAGEVFDRTTWPILSLVLSVNQSAPSGPVVISSGPALLVGIVYSVATPAGVIIPTLLLDVFSVNQIFPFGPAVIPKGVTAP